MAKVILKTSSQTGALTYPRIRHQPSQELERQDYINKLQQHEGVIGQASIQTFLDLECK